MCYCQAGHVVIALKVKSNTFKKNKIMMDNKKGRSDQQHYITHFNKQVKGKYSSKALWFDCFVIIVDVIMFLGFRARLILDFWGRC